MKEVHWYTSGDAQCTGCGDGGGVLGYVNANITSHCHPGIPSAEDVFHQLIGGEKVIREDVTVVQRKGLSDVQRYVAG